jgi:two-component sensor histidine kinase/Tfp pilus assembly protein PilF
MIRSLRRHPHPRTADAYRNGGQLKRPPFFLTLANPLDMKIPHCVVLSMCMSLSCYAQSSVDSLKALLLAAERERDDARIEYSLYQIGSSFYNSREYDSAINYYNLILKRTSSKVYRASALNGIGVSYSAIGLPGKSISYYTEAISLYEEIGDTTNAITNTFNLAIIYKDKGLYEKALDLCFNALPKLETGQPDRIHASAYNTIGTVYMRIQDYEKAYEFYRKSLSVRLAIGYTQGVGQSYNNLGELFNTTKDYDSALNNLYKAVEIRKLTNDNRGLARTLTLIGNSLTQSGKPREAVKELTKAMLLIKPSNDLIAEILLSHELGASYIAAKEFLRAEENLKFAASLIDKTGARDYLKRNLELQAELYRGVDNKAKLIRALERLMIVKDSVLNEEKVESMLALEVQYETEKKEQEIAILQEQRKTDQAELERNRLQIVGLVVSIGFLIVIAALGYRLYFVKQREKRGSELHNKEMHHRTKNNLQMLSSFFTIQASILEDDKKAQELIVDTQGRVKTMALVHNKLYRDADTSELNLQEYITDLVNSLLYTYGFTENRLRLDLYVTEFNIDIDKAVRIGLIINELITNALKYAYRDQAAPSLKISLLKKETGITIEVTDNGRHPLPSDEFENSRSFGLRMVKLFVRELKGHVELINSAGTSFFITIP